MLFPFRLPLRFPIHRLRHRRLTWHDMLRYLSAEELVDGTRAAVIGGSYGGYAVNAVLANFSGYFVAGTVLNGVADWMTAMQVASPGLKASDRLLLCQTARGIPGSPDQFCP